MSAWKTGVLLLIFFSILGGCSGGSSSSNEVTDPDPGPSDPVLTDPGTDQEEQVGVLGLVTATDGSAVANASVGTVAVSSGSGVALGAAGPETDEWLEIRAQGYAPDYVRPEGMLGGYAVFESVLTPVAAEAVHQAGSATILMDDAASPRVELHLAADLFTADTVFLELAVIEPENLGALFAPSDAGERLFPQVAFSIEAVDGNGQPAAFAAGRSATALLHDEGLLGDPPRLAWFNPESGIWEMEEGACTRLDAARVQCELAHFSTQGGMNGDSPGSGAWARFREAVSRWADEGGGPVPDDVEQALEDLAREALEFAAGNRNEIGKQKLLTVVIAADFVGRMDIHEELWSEAETIVTEIAQDLLSNPDCAKLQDILRAMVQCQVFGLDDLSQQLETKAKELADVCNVWTGKVNYNFIIPKSHPHLAGYRHYSGPLVWNEWHEVQLEINPQDLSIQGYDAAGLTAPKVTYRGLEDAECGGSYAERQNWGGGDHLFLTMTGSYRRDAERPHFTIGLPQKEMGQIKLELTDYARYFDSNDTSDCILQEIGPQTITSMESYETLLGAGLSGSPPLPLAEMLNEGNYTDRNGFEEIKGSRELELNIPAVGIYPFTRATVKWDFIHEYPDIFLDRGM